MSLNIKLTPIILPANLMPKAIWDKIEKEVESAVRNEAGDVIKKEMNRRVANWATRPTMRKRSSKPSGAIAAVTVFPAGAGRDRWLWVSQGTAPRLIVAKSPNRPLRVRLNYSPKTTPGGAFGRSSSYGGPVVYLQQVKKYKGIEARKFEEKIIKDIKFRMLIIIGRAVRRGLP